MEESIDYTPTFLTRSVSLIHTNQESEPTCWAHSIANLVSRYLRNLYDKDMMLFSSVNSISESCDFLFYTVSCKNIFQCILKEKYCSNQKIINSALLFRLLYNILLKMTRYNFCPLFQLGCIKKIMKYLKTMTLQDVIKKLKPTPEEYEIFQENINIVWSVIDATKHTFKPNYYSCTEGKKLDVGNLKKMLNSGFYAFLFKLNDYKITGHSMVITAYDTITNMYKIKNSWGHTDSFSMGNFFSEDNQAPASMFYNEKDKLLVDGVYYIFPTMRKETRRRGNSVSCGNSCFSRRNLRMIEKESITSV